MRVSYLMGKRLWMRKVSLRFTKMKCKRSKSSLPLKILIIKIMTYLIWWIMKAKNLRRKLLKYRKWRR
jgi:hypothetical protein